MNASATDDLVRCPDCAEAIRPEAHVCHHCGHRLDKATRATPVWPRIVGTIIYLAAATPLLANPDVAAEQRFLLGLLQAAVLLLIVGTINWSVALIRKTRRPWWHATFAAGPLVIAFAIALFGGLGRDANSQATAPATTHHAAAGRH